MRATERERAQPKTRPCHCRRTRPSSRMPSRHRERSQALSLVLAFLAAGLLAQEAPLEAPAGIEVTFERNGEWVDRNEELRLQLSELPTPEQGRLAVLIDQTDLTDLFRVDGTTLVYRPEVLPLPGGKHEIILYLTTPDGSWTELWRSALQVRRVAGIETVGGQARIDLEGTAQFDTGGNPADQRQDTFETGSAQFDLGGSLERRGWKLSGQLNVVGQSEIENALRFGELGDDADRVDLSAYSVRLEKNRTQLELGHVFFGEHRHLASGFASRGLRAGFPLGQRGDVQLVAVNGSNIVGWNNPLGLSRSEHQVLAGALGIELLGQRPGGLRLGLDYLDGSRLPLSDFNQGAVNDAEENDGWGARLAGSTPGQRLTFQLGYARSAFRNPFDPTLAQGFDVVPVDEEERSARYAQVDVALIQNRQLTELVALGLHLSLRHERVDPQYRTVAAFLQSDLEQNGVDLNLTLGAFSAQLGHQRSQDNLDDIPSILKTKTRRSHANFSIPLASLLSPQQPHPWLPAVGLMFDRTHQFGANQPINSGFSTTNHIPDQMNANDSLSIDWSGNRWRFGVGANYSDQDNRQPGRENNDFTNASYSLRLGLTPHQQVDLSLDWSRDRAYSTSDDRIDRNERLGLNLLWRPTDRLTVSALYSLTETENEPNTSNSESTTLNVEVAQRFDWRARAKHGGGGQLFLRYAEQDFESIDRLFGFDVLTDSWTLNAGFNLNFR